VNVFPTQGFADLKASMWGSDVRATGIASIWMATSTWVLTSEPLSVRVVALSGCVPDTSRKPPCVFCVSGLNWLYLTERWSREYLLNTNSGWTSIIPENERKRKKKKTFNYAGDLLKAAIKGKLVTFISAISYQFLTDLQNSQLQHTTLYRVIISWLQLFLVLWLRTIIVVIAVWSRCPSAPIYHTRSSTCKLSCLLWMVTYLTTLSTAIKRQLFN
jgi:hypothetical protein